MSASNWEVDLAPGWKIKSNPFGVGLILCIDRGISASNHIQVISAHTTKDPSEVDVIEHLAENSPSGRPYGILYREVIEHFLNLAGTMFTDLGWFQAHESVGLLVGHNIVRGVCKGAEDVLTKRHYGN